MLTMQEALNADEFHNDTCSRIVGPRGGVTERIYRVRRTGMTKTWKTRPSEYRVPVMHGMRDSGYITDRNADDWHVASACPITGACCSCEYLGKNMHCHCSCH